CCEPHSHLHILDTEHVLFPVLLLINLLATLRFPAVVRSALLMSVVTAAGKKVISRILLSEHEVVPLIIFK
ncbi:MAG: hypothetical protein ABN483_08955, partial [Pantoea agglomerans]